MSKEKKPGFLRRLFGGEPAADAPSRKATEKTAEVRNRKVEAASAAAPPPGTNAQPDKAEPRQTSRIVPPPPASKK